MCLLLFMAEYPTLLGISLAQHIWWYLPVDDTLEHNRNEDFKCIIRKLITMLTKFGASVG